MTDPDLDETVAQPHLGCMGRVVAENDGSNPLETPSEPILSDLESSPGEMLGHYQLLRVLGRGGQATSHLARDTRLERPGRGEVLPPGRGT